jgi:acid phosphatase (class A)
LADLDPARAAAILSRARAFGESRVVCGVHNASAIEAGRTNGAALVAALHGDAVFRNDMEEARREVASLRDKDPQPWTRACATEATLTAKTPW